MLKHWVKLKKHFISQLEVHYILCAGFVDFIIEHWMVFTIQWFYATLGFRVILLTLWDSIRLYIEVNPHGWQKSVVILQTL